MQLSPVLPASKPFFAAVLALPGCARWKVEIPTSKYLNFTRAFFFFSTFCLRISSACPNANSSLCLPVPPPPAPPREPRWSPFLLIPGDDSFLVQSRCCLRPRFIWFVPAGHEAKPPQGLFSFSPRARGWSLQVNVNEMAWGAVRWGRCETWTQLLLFNLVKLLFPWTD